MPNGLLVFGWGVSRHSALISRPVSSNCLATECIAHTYIKLRTLRLNGKVERSHRIDVEEFYRLLDGVIIDDREVPNDNQRDREDYSNNHRPHGGLGGQTPYERLKQKTAKPTAQA
ncbi:hypothetical protein SALBM311S_03795 [Streptomyces alboniger]